MVLSVLAGIRERNEPLVRPVGWCRWRLDTLHSWQMVVVRLAGLWRNQWVAGWRGWSEAVFWQLGCTVGGRGWSGWSECPVRLLVGLNCCVPGDVDIWESDLAVVNEMPSFSGDEAGPDELGKGIYDLKAS